MNENNNEDSKNSDDKVVRHTRSKIKEMVVDQPIFQSLPNIPNRRSTNKRLRIDRTLVRQRKKPKYRVCRPKMNFIRYETLKKCIFIQKLRREKEEMKEELLETKEDKISAAKKKELTRITQISELKDKLSEHKKKKQLLFLQLKKVLHIENQKKLLNEQKLREERAAQNTAMNNNNNDNNSINNNNNNLRRWDQMPRPRLMVATNSNTHMLKTSSPLVSPPLTSVTPSPSPSPSDIGYRKSNYNTNSSPNISNHYSNKRYYMSNNNRRFDDKSGYYNSSGASSINNRRYDNNQSAYNRQHYRHSRYDDYYSSREANYSPRDTYVSRDSNTYSPRDSHKK